MPKIILDFDKKVAHIETIYDRVDRELSDNKKALYNAKAQCVLFGLKYKSVCKVFNYLYGTLKNDTSKIQKYLSFYEKASQKLKHKNNKWKSVYERLEEQAVIKTIKYYQDNKVGYLMDYISDPTKYLF